MRYIWGSLGILVLIAGVTVWSSLYMAEITETMQDYLDAAGTAASREEVLRTLTRMEAYWEGQHWYLESVCVHNDLEEASATLSNLYSAALCDDDDDFLAAHRLIQVQLEHITRSEAFRLGNIL
ncbi:MAG: DUF4363 family protein [Ruminococcaceae bacterium]|nr:DUF4363 family protein [Oscillospiraceae bacterium]